MMNGISLGLNDLLELRYQVAALKIKHNKKVETSRTGGYRSALRGRGIDFDEVRIYQPGDDIRNMDWRVTARRGKPHTKLFCEERERPILILLDMAPSMYFGTRVAFKSVIAAQVAGFIAWSAVNQGDRVGGLVISGDKHIEHRPRTRSHGVLPLLKSVAEATKPGQEKKYGARSLEESLLRMKRVVRPGSSIFIISDFTQLSETAKNYLSILAMHNEVVVMFIYDSLEKELPPPNHYTLSNGLEHITIDTQLEKYCQNYKQQFEERRQNLKKEMNKRRITMIELATHEPILKSLQRVLV